MRKIFAVILILMLFVLSPPRSEAQQNFSDWIYSLTLASPATTDYIYVLTDPSGAKLAKHATIASILQLAISGTPANHYWAGWANGTQLKGFLLTPSKPICTDASGDPTVCTGTEGVWQTGTPKLDDVTNPSGAKGFTLLDNSQYSLDFGSTGKAHLIYFDTRNDAEGVGINGYLTASGLATLGTISAGAGGFTVDSDGDAVAKSINLASGGEYRINGTTVMSEGTDGTYATGAKSNSASYTCGAGTTYGYIDWIAGVPYNCYNSTNTQIPLATNPSLLTGSSLSAATGSGSRIPGSSLTAGSVYYQAAGGLTAAKADAAATMPGICIADSATSCMYSGVYKYAASQSWTSGQKIYVSAASAGALVTTAPATSGNQVQLVGVALANDTVLIMPSLVLVEVP